MVWNYHFPEIQGKSPTFKPSLAHRNHPRRTWPRPLGSLGSQRSASDVLSWLRSWLILDTLHKSWSFPQFWKNFSSSSPKRQLLVQSIFLVKNKVLRANQPTSTSGEDALVFWQNPHGPQQFRSGFPDPRWRNARPRPPRRDCAKAGPGPRRWCWCWGIGNMLAEGTISLSWDHGMENMTKSRCKKVFYTKRCCSLFTFANPVMVG